ncbi:MAG TPA: hypothetical protein PLV82_04505 [bacterium]|nr:hypothetical protein [bacterium]
MESFVLKTFLDQLTPGQLLLIAAVALIFIVVLRVNSYITQVKKLVKQQHKVIETISALPCINKENATWLQDDTKNGGAPPSKIEVKR